MLNANCTILTVQDPTQLRLDTTMQVRPAVLQVRVIFYVGYIYCEQQIAAAKQTLMLHVQICSRATAPNTDQCTCPKTDIAPDFVERLVFLWDGPILGATFNFACVSNIGNCFNFVLTLAARQSL